ncbi:NTP transferase domain-containing protein [Nanoarchaeota archaeon]
MKYKVCILAAGKGTRVSYSEIINKALLPVGDKSAISHIIDKFPEEVEIVIPLGYNGSQIKDFIELAHPERKVTFVEVDKWDGPGSGPGYSLLSCKKHLQCPFIFTACDTIVLENVPEPSMNWLGTGKVSILKDSKDYCVAEVAHKCVTKFYDKVDTATLLKTCLDYENILNNAFIGIAGILDYEAFWEGLEGDTHLIRNELQVSNGLGSLIPMTLEAVPFTWFDIGNQTSYEYTNRYFNKNKVLMKHDEFIYFEKDLVIKYFNNLDIVKKRIERAKILLPFVPKIYKHRNNFYAYKKISGRMLSQITNKKVFSQLLDFYNEKLWKKKVLSSKQKTEFKNACSNFYKKKTEERIKSFYEKTDMKDKEDIINGIKVPSLSSLLKKIDWKYLEEGIPVLFHGDFQPENIIVKGDHSFVLIDWRQDFNGIIDYGDIYYDFAKLYHALIINGAIIRNNQFEINIEKDGITYDFLAKGNLLEYKTVFEKFIDDKGYDINKIKILTSLIFLNIAALHHDPYNKFLYYLGKSTLFENLQEDI